MQSESNENPLSPSLPSSFLTPSHRFAIKSTNVILEEFFEPTEAIILIDNEKIIDVIIVSETDPQTLADLTKDWNIQDHGSLYVFPGLVDSNVHLHTDFNKEWENVSYATELAAAGGVTTIIDNPIMSKPYETADEYLESLERRISLLKSNSKVDFGVFGVLEPKTVDIIDKIMEKGPMGLKCFLLNCMQTTTGNFSSEDFAEVLEGLEKYKDLLLVIHPEIATEREIYLSSPCRAVSLEQRLDMRHHLKSLELGGAANKGSYLEELCKKASKEDEEDDDDDCPTAMLDTPTKLKSKIRKTKEKNEINDLVHFELLSYENNPEAEDSGSSSDSEDEENNKKKLKKNDSTSAETPGQNEDEGEIPTVDEKKDVEETTTTAGNVTRPTLDLSNFPTKKSLFSRINRETALTKKPFENIIELTEASENSVEESSQPAVERPRLVLPRFNQYSKPSADIVEITETEDQKQETLPEVEKFAEKDTVPVGEQKNNDEIKPPPTEETLSERQIILNNLRNPPPLHLPEKEGKTANKQVQLGGTNKVSNISKRLFKFLADADSKVAQQPQVNPGNIITFNNKESEAKDPKEASSITSLDSKMEKCADRGGSLFTQSGESLVTAETNSPSLSSRPMTPASSSLLMRRITRKSSNGVGLGITSSLSSPSSDFRKINSLDVIKSPRGNAKKEAKYNQNYRIFLANRPQCWEENAVTLVLSLINPETNLRIMLPNLSLASSFLKVREKKKSNEAFFQKIFCDSSASHLFFNEKMIKRGETKFKVAPPFRNKENRRLLVENFRLGGIDIVSSYHFYVPPRFKKVDDGNFRRAFGGIDSIGFSLQAVWTALYSHQLKTNKRFNEDLLYQRKLMNHIFRQIYKSMCFNPANMLKIGQRKGSIAKGKDADLVIWDPYKVTNNAELSVNQVFSGKALSGTVYKTYLRGNLIYDRENGDQIDKNYRPEYLQGKVIESI